MPVHLFIDTASIYTCMCIYLWSLWDHFGITLGDFGVTLGLLFDPSGLINRKYTFCPTYFEIPGVGRRRMRDSGIMPILTESSRRGLKSLSARLGAHQMRVPLVGGRHPIEDIGDFLSGGDSLPGSMVSPRKNTKSAEYRATRRPRNSRSANSKAYFFSEKHFFHQK